jgi:H+/Cl- antiporter ClcA|tara:strand:- start:96 stop:467 length:372 start_codon:yes stop_codon:yes gene_type:complete
MEHILELYLVNIQSNMRGFIFGFVHVAIMLVGYYSGWSINRLLKIMSNGYIAGIIGAALAHIVADVVASLIDPHVRSMVVGIVLGGLIPLLAIPILERYVIKSKNHIVVGDHEDIEKDLKEHH